MYRALFELSENRVDFLSQLFSRPRPPDVGLDTDVGALFASCAGIAPDAELFDRSLDAILDVLVGRLQARRFATAGVARQCSAAPIRMARISAFPTVT